jgi:flagellar biosynthetic protein FliR
VSFALGLLRSDPIRPELALLALELARVSGVVVVSPIPWNNTPSRIRVGLIIFLLAVVHHMGASPVTEIQSAAWAALHISTEFIVGVAIGLVVRLSIASAEIAGSTLALPMGFTAARAYDPSFGQSETSLGQLLRNLTLLVALIGGFHRVMLGALLSSFRLLPVGTVLHVEASFPLFLELSSLVIGVGVRLALPVLAILLMANVALGFVSRAAPSMQIFNIGFAVLFATGAIGLFLGMPEFSHELGQSFSRNAVYFERLLSDLAQR